ncbi:hypothetical protein LTR66_003191 [Elasticomyces elasticus]|nr:hypothetical protein LTR66_003191 [Elasticomyces elasticus]
MSPPSLLRRSSSSSTLSNITLADTRESSVNMADASSTPPTSLPEDVSSDDSELGAKTDRVLRGRRAAKSHLSPDSAATAAENETRAFSGATLVEPSPQEHSSSTVKSELTEKPKAAKHYVQPDPPVLKESKNRLRNERDAARRKSSRLASIPDTVSAAAAKVTSVLGKRSRDALEGGREMLSSVKGLGRRASTLSRGQSQGLVSAGIKEPPAKRSRIFPNLQSSLLDPDRKADRLLPAKEAIPAASIVTVKPTLPRKEKKKWLAKGLYVGQHRHFDGRLTESKNKAKQVAVGSITERTHLPLPMFGHSFDRIEDRDFVIPYDVFAPLPKGQEKPTSWGKLNHNRFVGEATDVWKKKKLPRSSCMCSPPSNEGEMGCGHDCLNRSMDYECDEENCPLPADRCSNRAFATLDERCAKGNKYDVGVEVVKTTNRGFGVRACREFQPDRIIVEYTGEIITSEERDRRMNEEYKNNECYYLMSFQHGMIIDATRGSIARFVNHSCEPNCRVEKITFQGRPRVAMSAGPNGIKTGEELTYDYKFDPFSAANVQECRCGAPSCRGVLGPKPRPKETKKGFVAGVKRTVAKAFGMAESEESDGEPRERQRGRKVLTRRRSDEAETSGETKQKGKKQQLEKENDARAARRAARQSSSSSAVVSASSTPQPQLQSQSTPGLLQRTTTTTTTTTVSTRADSAISAVEERSSETVSLLHSLGSSSRAAEDKTKEKRSSLRQSTLSFQPLGSRPVSLKKSPPAREKSSVMRKDSVKKIAGGVRKVVGSLKGKR